MKRLALFAVLLAAAPVAAEPPAGWNLDETLSLDLTRKAQRGSYFGGTETTKIVVGAFLAPSGGSLFVTRAEAAPPVDLRDGVATRALLGLAQTASRQTAAQIESTVQRADPAAKLLEASLTWRDPAAGIRQISRTIVAADAQRLVAVTGECMLPDPAPKAIEDACVASLAALDPGIAVDQRVALALVSAPLDPAPSTGTAAPEPTAPANPAASTPRMGEQPRLGDGSRTPMAPMTISPAKREVERRPLYLGGGIVVLAAIFWWNRRRRDQFDREGDPNARTAPEPAAGDDDADDLQAAARGEGPKDES